MELPLRTGVVLAFPFAPSVQQWKIESQLSCAAERLRVLVQLSRITLSFTIEKAFDIGAFMRAGLVIDDPARAVLIAQRAVEHHAPDDGRVALELGFAREILSR